MIPSLYKRLMNLFYQVFFGKQETVDFVLTNGPWNFENSLVLVRPFTIVSNRGSIYLTKEYFWLLLTRLPRICYMLDIAPEIGSCFGFLCCDATPRG